MLDMWFRIVFFPSRSVDNGFQSRYTNYNFKIALNIFVLHSILNLESYLSELIYPHVSLPDAFFPLAQVERFWVDRLGRGGLTVWRFDGSRVCVCVGVAGLLGIGWLVSQAPLRQTHAGSVRLELSGTDQVRVSSSWDCRVYSELINNNHALFETKSQSTNLGLKD